VQQKTLS